MSTDSRSTRRSQTVRCLLPTAILCLSALTVHAHADAYLVGAMLFAADGTGATVSTGYQYDTNTIHDNGSVTPLDLTFKGVTYGKGISLALDPGSNQFSFSEDQSTPISTFGGVTGDLGLFFSSSNTSYNPASGARTPDLLVSRRTDGSLAFFFPTAGTTINDYTFTGTTTANGATSVTLGTDTIQVSNYSLNDSGSGAFNLSVSGPSAATPEPGSVAMLVGMGVSGAGLAIRRNRRRK